jgi:hypothetical protein
MNNLKFFSFVAIAASFVFVSCEKEEEMPQKGNLMLDIQGLTDLGPDYVYEGWLIVDGAAISSGVFSVDANGDLSRSSFEIDQNDLDDASTFVLTIEPNPDPDPNPSDVHILAGDFSGNSGMLTVGHGAALGDDFTSSSGNYILATPTDGNMDMNEQSGIWWLDPAAGPGAGLSLPTLPAGWAYEGWVVIDGMAISTGTFLSIDAADDAAPFSGMVMGPPFPGEDFLLNAPMGLNFPTSLVGMTAVISVEPVPDNSTDPFVLKPLVGQIPSMAMAHSLYPMSNNADATNPTGTASR